MYTYEQFQSAAAKAGLLDKFDQQDLVIARANPEYGVSMLQLLKNKSEAKTAEQQALADSAVRQLRNNYQGYTSAGRLAEYADEVIQQTDNYYAGQNAYRQALADAEGYGSFGYDSKVGDIYQRQSASERDRARANTLAAASARTGGRPSSYAMTLAQQTAGDMDAQTDEALLNMRKSAYLQALEAAENKDKDNDDDGSKVDILGMLGGMLSSGANALLDGIKSAFKPAPKETDHVRARLESIEGNIHIMEMSGASDYQIKQRILGYLNNDGFVGDLSDGEWAWLMNHLEKYQLLDGGK